MLKNLTDVETNVNYKGNFVEMNVMGKLIQKKDNEISLKSIYQLITTKFKKMENDIEFIKQDMKSVKEDVKNLDTKLNKVIDLNKDIISLNKINVSKENKTWLFDNNDNNTPSK